MMDMFCRQCEQTAAGKGCTARGVCGKDNVTATLQDALIHIVKGIAVYGREAARKGVKDPATDVFIQEALFTTVTNVNFDPERIRGLIVKALDIREKIKGKLINAAGDKCMDELSASVREAASWTPDTDMDPLLEEAKKVGVLSYGGVDEDVRSLREILLYGVKGMAAYADHASIMGKTDPVVTASFYDSLAALTDDTLSADDLIAAIMDFGKANLKCMEILDEAHTGLFGHPVPTEVSLGHKKGPAIVVSGHDLPDLKMLLEQTAGKGVNVYTHGEMLPAHGYPGLNKYPHLAGHYGGAWQDQQKEFDAFPGAVLMTTNCIQKPRDTYKDRIFTTGLVAWPDVTHIPSDGGKKDFSPVIEKALETGGFDSDTGEGKITVGFARNAVLGVADKVIEAVKGGNVRHFFLIGGCDGAKPGRNYYTELASKVPADCVILTLACGKFRFNRMDFGDIGGIPRLLDCGQCNDAYSAISIASALADAFECGVNDLPLSLVLSWYEQKAVCILLTLLSLGIKDIRLGPSLPAFVSANVLDVLVKNFGIKPISTPEEDLKAILG